MPKAKKLPSGNWRVQVYSHKNENGRPVYRSFTAATKKEAEFLAAQFVNGKSSGNVPANITLRQAARKFIDGRDNVLSPSTINGYEKILRTAMPEIWDMKVSAVTSEKLQNAVNRYAKEPSERTGRPRSAKTVTNAYGFVVSVLTEFNPDFKANVRLPSKQKKYRDYPEPEDVIKAIKGTNVELPCMLAMWLSLTMSEVRGIRCLRDIKDGVLTVRAAILDVAGEHIDRQQTKVDSRTRRHVIPGYIMQLIESQETYIKAKETGEDRHLIDKTGSVIYKRFVKAMKDSGLEPIRFHDLRHMSASIMLQLGVPDKYAMERGGWKTDKVMKSVYQHTFSSGREKSDTKINEFFESIISD